MQPHEFRSCGGGEPGGRIKSFRSGWISDCAVFAREELNKTMGSVRLHYDAPHRLGGVE